MHKLVSHDYFMDDMLIADVMVMTKYVKYSDALSWNQTRQLMLCSLKPYLKKKDMTAEELFPLPTDDDNKEELTTVITNEEVEWWKKFKEQYNKGEQ